MILETERIQLCKITPNDVAFIFELLNTPTWLQYIGDKGIKTLADARDYIITGPMASYNKYGFGLWLVKLKQEQVPIGMCGLMQRDYLENVDIGFALLPQYTGKGYAYEAAKATLDYAKTNLNLKKIVAFTDIDNEHSISLLKKLGMSFEKMITIPTDSEELMLFSTTSDFTIDNSL
jgi:RimJ/RimL family protein N-acetyltransferase